MKKFNLLKNIGAVLMLILVFNCSVDNSIDKNPSSKKIDNNPSRNKNLRYVGPCTDIQTFEIYAVYDFPILSQIDENGNNITRQQIREDYETEMAQHFTICNIISSTNCDNIDRWTVNIYEFSTYWNGHTFGTGSGSGTIGVEGGAQEGNSYSHCFNQVLY